MIGTVTVVETQFERDLRNRHLAGALDPRSWTCVLGNSAHEQEIIQCTFFYRDFAPLRAFTIYWVSVRRVLEVN